MSAASCFDPEQRVIRAAREDFDYAPEVSVEQGLELLAHWLASEASKIDL